MLKENCMEWVSVHSAAPGASSEEAFIAQSMKANIHVSKTDIEKNKS